MNSNQGGKTRSKYSFLSLYYSFFLVFWKFWFRSMAFVFALPAALLVRRRLADQHTARQDAALVDPADFESRRGSVHHAVHVEELLRGYNDGVTILSVLRDQLRRCPMLGWESVHGEVSSSYRTAR
jgi:hypothetical protein